MDREGGTPAPSLFVSSAFTVLAQASENSQVFRHSFYCLTSWKPF